MRGLLPVATFSKNGLLDKNMVPRLFSRKSHVMTINKRMVVNILVSSRHHYTPKNQLFVVQVIVSDTQERSSVRYHYIIPKDESILLFNLKYNFEEDGRLNLYIELDDPLINILSLSDASGIIMNNKSITDFPEDAIDATEV